MYAAAHPVLDSSSTTQRVAEEFDVRRDLARFDVFYIAEHLAQMIRCEVRGRVIVRVLADEDGAPTSDLGIVADAHTRRPAFIAGRTHAEWAGADEIRETIERIARKFWSLTASAVR